MKRVRKSILVFFLAISFIVMSAVPAMAAKTTKHIDYVAFGDSVAAGVRGGIVYPWDPGYDTESNKGYTDDIANMLNEADILSSFNKNEDFCASGMTAARLAQNSAILNIPDTAKWHLVKDAEIVTLDIGANDLLIPFYGYIGTLTNDQKIALGYIQENINNPALLMVTLQQPEVAGIIEGLVGKLNDIMVNLYNPSPSENPLAPTGYDVQHNIETIMQNILNANKNVRIYVMGYYNPLIGLVGIYNQAYNKSLNIDEPVMYFNGLINGAIEKVKVNNRGASITYVGTMSEMSLFGNLVLTDIHPTEAGHLAIARKFFDQISTDLSLD
jgi:GDSL-like Lipase/Acylhydrolase.